MNKLFYPSLLIIIISGITGFASAKTLPYNMKADTIKKVAAKDTDIDIDLPAEKASFKVGVDFISDNVFMGRSGPVVSPTISPNIKYTFKSGLFFSGNVDFIPKNSSGKLDGGNIAAGWNFDITDNLSAGGSFTKLFYNTNSNQIGSTISSVFNANLDYNIADIITPSISFDFNSNKSGIKDDFFFNFGLSHDFASRKIFGEKDLILISPTVEANIGTQNFYDAYITKFKSKARTAAQDQLIAAFETGLNQSKLLDYEVSVPIEYKSGIFIFTFTPTYAFVQNGFKPAAAAALGLTNATSVFYFTTGISLKF
jgi:hypothetical protein